MSWFLSTYVIAVVWFPDMEENDDILDEADGRSVHRALQHEIDLVQRLANLPTEDQLQGQLSSRYIKQEVTALSWPTAAAAVVAGTDQGSRDLASEGTDRRVGS